MPETSDTTVTWLTQEAYDRLKAELDHLSGPGRREIAKKINTAREEGDLSENGGYHAAREEQGKQEARILQLTALLRSAHVGEAADDGKITAGTVVTVDLLGDELTFLLGNRELKEGDDDLEVYSEQSPLGHAILGKSAGDEASYEAPNGRTITVKIKSAEPYRG